MNLSLGARYILIATFSFSLMQVGVKQLSHLPTSEIVVFRSLISIVLCLWTLRKNRIPIFGNNKGLLISRGLAGAIALFLFFYTIQNIPLASAISIHYITPIFTAILSLLIMKEKTTPLQWISFCITFLGVLIIKGFDARIGFLDLGAGILGAMLAGTAYNIIRKLKGRDHPMVIILYFPLMTIPLFLPFAIYNWVWPKGVEWLSVLLVGIATQIGQYFMTKAYQQEQTSNIAIYTYTGVLFGMTWGLLFFKETLPISSALGIAVMFFGIIAGHLFRRPTLQEKTEP